ncbi:hypothetical protein [Streptomyces sp. XD-27]|uniref:hypothetical protein n=1 Tax=Streptomyces sp. XD-27 TaxID=3062779 RepID=UPI0026F439CF|nr:hypothetical protein [Streptomyces sp. XD-27]WKX71602.1 hypothetical protein Q3Y56_18265 [Streptomyces sp. XD-27]
MAPGTPRTAWQSPPRVQRLTGRPWNGEWTWKSVHVATAVLVVEVFLAFVVYGFVALTEESPQRQDGPAVQLIAAPFMACLVYPAALLFSMAITLPTAALARWTGPRWGGSRPPRGCRRWRCSR